MKYSYRRGIAALLSLAAALSLTACGGGAASTSASGTAASGDTVQTFTVGTRGTVAAYSYVDEDNNLTGYDIEILREIDRRLPDVAFEFQTMDLSSCFVALEAGQIDLIANQLVHNEERDSKYLFNTLPYGYAVSRLIVRGEENGVTSLDDLKGKTMALTPTSESARAVRQFNETADSPINVVNFDGGSAETFSQVATGQADATAGYKPTVENSDYDLKVVGDPIASVPVYFILRQDDQAAALVQEIDTTLQAMIDDGTVSALSQQFLGEDVLAAGTSSAG